VSTSRLGGGARLAPVIGSAAAGATSALAFPPLGPGWLQPFAVATLYLAIRRTTLSCAWLRGLAFGLAFFLVHLSWLDESIGMLAWLLLSLTQAAFVAFASLGMRVVAGRRWSALGAAAVWTLVETTRGTWPLGGMPWGRLGYSALDTPWQSLLPVLGVSGMSFLITWASFASVDLGESLLSRRRTAARHALVSATVVAVALSSLPWGPTEGMEPTGSSLRVAVIQGGVPGDGTELVRFHRQVTQNHALATEALGRRLQVEQDSVDVVVWPENSTAVDPRFDPAMLAAIDHAGRAVGAPILLGAITDGPTDQTAFNQSLLWDAERGEYTRAYTKQNLVPFGEYIPWRSIIGSWSRRFDQIPRDLIEGNSGQTFRLGTIGLATAICFDVAHDDVIADQVLAGARMVVVQTSNATFFGTKQLDQQFGITRTRAVESGRAVVVASTNGVSAMIAADGKVVQRAPKGVTSALIGDVGLHDSITPALRWRTLRETMIGAIALLALLLAMVLPRLPGSSHRPHK